MHSNILNLSLRPFDNRALMGGGAVNDDMHAFLSCFDNINYALYLIRVYLFTKKKIIMILTEKTLSQWEKKIKIKTDFY